MLCQTIDILLDVESDGSRRKALGYWLKGPGSFPGGVGVKIYLNSFVTSLSMRPIQLLLKWVQELSSGYRRRSVGLAILLLPRAVAANMWVLKYLKLSRRWLLISSRDSSWAFTGFILFNSRHIKRFNRLMNDLLYSTLCDRQSDAFNAGIGSHVLDEVSRVWRCRGSKYTPIYRAYWTIRGELS